MYAKITSSSATSSTNILFSFNGRDASPQLNLSTFKDLRKIDRSNSFLKFKSQYGVSRIIISNSSNIRPKASSSSDSSSSSSPWKKWLFGILFTVILPAAGHKGGLLLGLKGKIDQAIETVEHVTEVVEEIAEEADRIVEEVEKKLPGDSKLKDALDSLENLAEMAVKEAKKAEDIVHKVKEVEEEIETALLRNDNEQAKK